MGPSTCRYGSKVSRNLGGSFRNNTTKFGGIQNETCAEANPVLTTLRHPALGRFWIQDTPNVTKCNFASLGVAIAVTRLGLGHDFAPVQTEK